MSTNNNFLRNPKSSTVGLDHMVQPKLHTHQWTLAAMTLSVVYHCFLLWTTFRHQCKADTSHRNCSFRDVLTQSSSHHKLALHLSGVIMSCLVNDTCFRILNSTLFIEHIIYRDLRQPQEGSQNGNYVLLSSCYSQTGASWSTWRHLRDEWLTPKLSALELSSHTHKHRLNFLLHREIQRFGRWWSSSGQTVLFPNFLVFIRTFLASAGGSVSLGARKESRKTGAMGLQTLYSSRWQVLGTCQWAPENGGWNGWKVKSM